MTEKHISDTEKIFELYKLIPYKKYFYQKVSKEFGTQITSIRTNWFGVGSIPFKVSEKLLTFTEDYVKGLRKEGLIK